MTSSIHRMLRRPHTNTIFSTYFISHFANQRVQYDRFARLLYAAVLFNQCQMKQSDTRKSETAVI